MQITYLKNQCAHVDVKYLTKIGQRLEEENKSILLKQKL